MNHLKQPNCLVVMYHYVHDEPPVVEGETVGPHQGIRGLTTRAFAEQIELLLASREPIDWPTLKKGIEGRTTLPRESFLLTFDDGLADHARHVAPMLEERGLRGLFFVPGETITDRRMLSAHAVHLLLSQLGDDELAEELRLTVSSMGYRPELAEFSQTEGQLPPASSTAYRYESAVRAEIKAWLHLGLPIDLRRQVVDVLFERHIGSSTAWADRWYLSREDVRALQSRGHTIGGHGFSHEPLARLTDNDRHADVSRCAQTLNEWLGTHERPISYPFGSFIQSTAEACRNAGFVQAFTTESRLADSTDDAMRVPRVDTIHVNQFLEKVPTCP